MVHTTLPKQDKADTSSVEAPTAQALVARPGSETPDDSLADDDPNLLNFAAGNSEIICRMSSWLQNYWSNSGKVGCPVWNLDGSFFVPHDAGPAILVLGHEDVEGGLWAALRLAPSFFWLDHPR
jgi:hypothetical protein